jgi:hypothetical protein
MQPSIVILRHLVTSRRPCGSTRCSGGVLGWRNCEERARRHVQSSDCSKAQYATNLDRHPGRQSGMRQCNQYVMELIVCTKAVLEEAVEFVGAKEEHDARAMCCRGLTTLESTKERVVALHLGLNDSIDEGSR